jgi:NAD(P)-dependent dehydrogenase (short-subunit alcohol dehydrogenase family)
MFEFENERVIVVGASRGLGSGVAMALADAGARVLGIARDEAALLRLKASSGDRIDIAAGDATDAGFAARVLKGEDPACVLLVAGATPAMKPVQEHDWASFSEVWETDVKLSFNWLRHLVTHPLRRRGRIIVFSSGAALHGSSLSGGYAPAKQAQRYLCDYVRAELARAGRDTVIQCVLPKLTPHTDLGKVAVAAYARLAGETVDEYVQRQSGGQPLTARIAGDEMVNLLSNDALRSGREFLLTGAGMKLLDK